jgi:hypothetical protein
MAGTCLIFKTLEIGRKLAEEYTKKNWRRTNG